MQRTKLRHLPVIDRITCSRCGDCVRFCRHKRLEMVEDKPVLVQKEECPDNCRTCARICPAEAISFIDEDAFIARLQRLLQRKQNSLQ